MYIGQGVWSDATNKKWMNGDIHEFETDTNAKHFLDDRKDIKFMVEYGSMKINSISIDTETPANQSKNQENTEADQPDISKIDTKDGEGKTKKPVIVQAK